jgi:hypothetical protein
MPAHRTSHPLFARFYARDTAAAVRAAGFTIERLDRFRFPDTRLTLPTSPHLSAIASRTP